MLRYKFHPGILIRLSLIALSILASFLAPFSLAYADPRPPTVITLNASDITVNSAVLNGSLWSLEGNSSAVVSFEWGPSSNKYGNEAFPVSPNMTSPGFFSTRIGSLQPNTTYYFRAKAVAHETSHGYTLNFKTANDTTPPGAVTDLSTGSSTTSSITLNWTAPGNDGNIGTAAAYDIRYSTETINDSSWANATPVSGEPVPQSPGSNESFVINGLNPDTDYYFVLKTGDAANNWSALSNCAGGTTLPLPVTYTLTTASSEGGTILAPGIGPSGPYNAGQVVDLTAGPYPGYHFVNWTGDVGTIAGITSANTTITMNGNYSIRANFAVDIVDYSLTTIATGSGSVTRNPDQVSYSNGTSVQLTAVPAAGWSFSNWTGDLTGTANPQSITMNGNKSVTAIFTQNTYSLIVNTSGSGSINRDNSGPYYYNYVVQLTAVPVEGWSFSSWSGDLTGTLNPHSITINGNKSVTATFTKNNDTLPPAPVTDLTTGDLTPSSIKLTWTAPGNDGNTGTATSYDIRYSTNQITDSSFVSATPVTSPAPQPAGSTETITVSGLNAGTTYYFALKASDGVPNLSAISNIASGTTSQLQISNGGSMGGFISSGGGVASGPGVTNLGMFTDAQGLFNLPAVAESEDGTVQLNIAQGVMAKDKDGNRLDSITIEKANEIEPAPVDTIIVGTIYDFGPDEATFDPPVTLSFEYDLSSLPPGLTAHNLVVVTWDTASGKWIEIGGTIDSTSGKISVPVHHFSRYAVIAHAAPALFNISSLSVSSETVKIGESVTIKATVTNRGDLSGSYKVTLRLNDIESDSRELSLSGGSTGDLTFSATGDNPGNYNVDVNGLTTRFTVEKPVVTTGLKVTGLETPQNQVTAGDYFNFSALVNNPGDITATLKLDLKINSAVVDTKEVSLPPGTNDRVIFTISENTAGTYSYEVAGFTGQFVVQSLPAPVREALNWWIIGAIICASTAFTTVIVLTRLRNSKLQPIS